MRILLSALASVLSGPALAGGILLLGVGGGGSPSQVPINPGSIPGLVLAFDPSVCPGTTGCNVGGGIATAIPPAPQWCPTCPSLTSTTIGWQNNVGPLNQPEFVFDSTGSNFGTFVGAGSTLTNLKTFTLIYIGSYPGLTGSRLILSNSANGQMYVGHETQAAGMQLNIGPSGGNVMIAQFPTSTVNSTGHIRLLPHMAALTYNTSGATSNGLPNNSVQAFADGQPGMVQTSSANLPTGNGFTFDRFGRNGSGWQGPVGPWLVYNTILTATQIQGIWLYFHNWMAWQVYVSSSSGNDNNLVPTKLTPWAKLVTAVSAVVNLGVTIAPKCSDTFRVSAFNDRILMFSAPTTVDGTFWCPTAGAAQLLQGRGADIRGSTSFGVSDPVNACTNTSGTIYRCIVVGGSLPFDLSGPINGGSSFTPGAGYPVNQGKAGQPSIQLTITGGTCPIPITFSASSDATGKIDNLLSSDPLTELGACSVWPANPGSTTASQTIGGVTTPLSPTTNATIYANYQCGGGSHLTCISGSQCSHAAVGAPGTPSINQQCGYVYYVPTGVVTFFDDGVCPYCGTNVVRMTHDTGHDCAPGAQKWGYDELGPSGGCGPTARALYVNPGVALSTTAGVNEIEVANGGRTGNLSGSFSVSQSGPASTPGSYTVTLSYASGGQIDVGALPGTGGTATVTVCDGTTVTAICPTGTSAGTIAPITIINPGSAYQTGDKLTGTFTGSPTTWSFIATTSDEPLYPTMGAVGVANAAYRNLSSMFWEFGGLDFNGGGNNTLATRGASGDSCYNVVTAFTQSDGFDLHGDAINVVCTLWLSAYNGRVLAGSFVNGVQLLNTSFGNTLGVHDSSSITINQSWGIDNDQTGYGWAAAATVNLFNVYSKGIVPFEAVGDDCQGVTITGQFCQIGEGHSLIQNSIGVLPTHFFNPPNPLPVAGGNFAVSQNNGGVKGVGNYMTLQGVTLMVYKTSPSDSVTGTIGFQHLTGQPCSINPSPPPTFVKGCPASTLHDVIISGFDTGLSTNAGSTISLTHDFNLFNSVTANFNGTTQGPNEVIGNPLFIAPPENLRIPSGSPAKNAGCGSAGVAPCLIGTMITDFGGNPRNAITPSIGAWE